jgi:hypothetical protein
MSSDREVIDEIVEIHIDRLAKGMPPSDVWKYERMLRAAVESGIHAERRRTLALIEAIRPIPKLLRIYESGK